MDTKTPRYEFKVGDLLANATSVLRVNRIFCTPHDPHPTYEVSVARLGNAEPKVAYVNNDFLNVF